MFGSLPEYLLDCPTPVAVMEQKLRRIKITELKARLVLYELESSALIRELGTRGTSTQRRAEIYLRRPRLKFELTEALNDLAWLTAEDRLKRPDSINQLSVLVH